MGGSKARSQLWGSSHDTPEPLVVLALRDPDESRQPSACACSAAYGLTPTESALADQLLHGATLIEAASARGISINTARTHMKRIYSKTGTGRQAELVRLLAQAALTTG